MSNWVTNIVVTMQITYAQCLGCDQTQHNLQYPSKKSHKISLKY